jgi:hypothetical protein
MKPRTFLAIAGLAALLGACSSGGSTPASGSNVSSATVTVIFAGSTLSGQAVVESTGFTAGAPGTPTGVLASQSTNASGQTTFSGIFVSGQYCFSATIGFHQSYQCYNGTVPSALTLTP